METKLLKVGDKVYHIRTQRFSDNIYYEFSTVKRLTNTRAILEDDTQLINKPEKDYFGDGFGYGIYGDKWDKWYLTTPKIIEECKKERYRQKVNKWFEDKKFTDEEKKLVYEQLNKQHENNTINP